MDWPTIAIIITWLVLSGLASLIVLRNSASSSTRRFIQLAIVWALPVLGAIICLAVISAQSQARASSLDRAAFTENTGAAAPDIDMPPGSSICGCSSSDGGGDGGD
jgi:hypothetical protein